MKRNGEGESVTLMVVAHMTCTAKEREARERASAGFERDPWIVTLTQIRPKCCPKLQNAFESHFS